MNHKHYELLIASKLFETLSKETHEFLHKIMLETTKVRDIEVEESVLEVEMEVEVAALTITEVLTKVPK